VRNPTTTIKTKKVRQRAMQAAALQQNSALEETQPAREGGRLDTPQQQLWLHCYSEAAEPHSALQQVQQPTQCHRSLTRPLATSSSCLLVQRQSQLNNRSRHRQGPTLPQLWLASRHTAPFDCHALSTSDRPNSDNRKPSYCETKMSIHERSSPASGRLPTKTT
jgi:hypothetical protein